MRTGVPVKEKGMCREREQGERRGISERKEEKVIGERKRERREEGGK